MAGSAGAMGRATATATAGGAATAAGVRVAGGRAVTGATAARRARRLGWNAVRPYAYLAPAALVLFTFHLWPMLYGAWISLHHWGLRKMGFAGLTNYAGVLGDPDWWRSLLVTLFYVAGTVPFELALGMGLAVLLFGRVRGRDAYRLLYFLPYITSLAAIGIVWGWLFNGSYGLINAVLRALGVQGPAWLEDPTGLLELALRPLGLALSSPWTGPSLALVAIMVVTVWTYVGFHVVVYLAGLAQVPTAVWDAARLDGAGGWALFRHITVPLLSPTTYFLSVVATIGAFQGITLIYVITGMGWGASGASGAPLGTTRVAMLYVFDYFFTYSEVGYASAAAMLLLLVLLGLTVLQMRLHRRRVFYFGGEEGI